MNVDSILISEYATRQAGGLLTVVNCMNTLQAKSPPLVLPSLALSLIIHGHADEAGTKHAGEIQLIDSSRTHVDGPWDFEWAFAPRKDMKPGLPLRHIQIWRGARLRFEQEGPYAFEVYIDGTYHAGGAFYVEFTG